MGLWLDIMGKVGFKVKNVIVWDKGVHGLNYQNYAYTYELIIYAVKGEFRVNNKFNAHKGYYKDIWHINRCMHNLSNLKHATIKNIEVVRLPLLHASSEGDLVFDGFMGSGSTALACKQLKRRFIGFEINKDYCDLANSNLAQSILF